MFRSKSNYTSATYPDAAKMASIQNGEEHTPIVSTQTRQFSGEPSNFAPATSNGTVFTLAAGERGFIQNLADAALAVKLGGSPTTSSFSFILKAGSAADDGLGGSIFIEDHVDPVSVVAMSGTARYIAWKQAV